MDVGISFIATAILVNILVIVGSVFFAFQANGNLRREEPESLPYRWGFFLGTYTLVNAAIGLLVLLALLLLPGAILPLPREFMSLFVGTMFLTFLLVAPMHILSGWIGYRIICRRRWALILITALTFNPLIYIPSTFYIAKRWHELSRVDPSRYRYHR